MSDFAQLSMTVKNGFLDVVDMATSSTSGARRRPSSMPPAICRRAHAEGSSDPDLEAAAAQLVRLDSIVRDGAKPERLSGMSTVPSPSHAQGSPRWSSFDSGAEEEDATPTSASGSPTMQPRSMDIDSFYPSAGSAGHAAGTCRPCAFARSPAGCKFGVSCNFCHLVTEHPESVRMRPCKGKRERFKRTMAAIEEKVAENPDLLSGGGLVLPAYVDRNPEAKARILAQLAQVAAEAYRGMAAERVRVA
mmetsp:Transcript_92610/g.267417  ORF Transcript_92610/g.267417 Transcript_92610/m.267417 type:complete len:248 (-) Transcript_92610:537-1280(-)